MENKGTYERYHRQMILEDFGLAGQEKLRQAKVLVVGAGGLGCPVLLYLAAAGLGQIGVADDGLVELSNLHRQVIYGTGDIGKLKVECAKTVLERLNPQVRVQAYPYRLSSRNAWDLIGGYDIVIDGSDNFQTRYMVNDACALLGKPLVFGAVSRYEGQVTVFRDKLNYRDIFPSPPQEGEVLNCSEAGVLGVLTGIIGSFLANECIKLVTGTGKPLTGELLTYNALNNSLYSIAITPAGSGLLPAGRETFEATDYDYFCGHAPAGVEEIGHARLLSLLKDEEIDLVDVRELREQPELNGFDHLRIPFSDFEAHLSLIKRDTVVFACQSGKRSLIAARRFRELNGPDKKKIYSLKGGIPGLAAIPAPESQP
ncbi:MAG TPA: HesA/MoeB/ThiF family protein [Anseongella sp.]|nr:HesA/MoeB/ThiF family protein [Anseongella sp.]